MAHYVVSGAMESSWVMLGRNCGCSLTCCEMKEEEVRKQSERCAMTLENHNTSRLPPEKETEVK